MVKNAAAKLRALQAEKKKMLEDLAENGLTYDENGKIVRQDQCNSESNSGQDDSDSCGSDSEDEGQVISSFKKAAKPPKAVANMQAQLAVTMHRVARKKKKAPLDETTMLIRDCVKNKLWALCKIIHGEKAQEKAAEKCLELLNLDGFTGKGKHFDAQRQQWIKAYGPVVTAAINNHRSYVQNRVKDACQRWMAAHGNVLPSEEVLKKCLERKIDLNNAYEVEVMKWYWDDLMAVTAGNMDDWHPDKRLYMLLSTASPPNDDSMPYITSSTEAIALAFIENNRSKWPALIAAKEAYPRAKELRVTSKVKVDAAGNPTAEFAWHHGIANGVLLCNGEKYMTKFTETAAGQQEFNGWNKAGRDYNVAMKKLNEAARKAKGCKRFEKEILDKLRADYGKTAATAAEERNSKRRKRDKEKAPVEEDEEDGMEF